MVIGQAAVQTLNISHRLCCREAYMLSVSIWKWHSVMFQLEQLLASDVPTPRMIPREYKAGWSDVTTTK